MQPIRLPDRRLTGSLRLLFVGVVLSCDDGTAPKTDPGQPVIVELSPAVITAGSAATDLIISGRGFLPESEVIFGDGFRSVTYISSTEPERFVRMEIAEALGPCHDAHRWRQCLQMREQTFDRWGNFYWTIAGFTYEPGYQYVLRVGVRPVKEKFADGPSYDCRLVRLESKTPVP